MYLLGCALLLILLCSCCDCCCRDWCRSVEFVAVGCRLHVQCCLSSFSTIADDGEDGDTSRITRESNLHYCQASYY